MGFSSLGQGCGAGGAGLGKPFLPAADFSGQLQQGLALLFRLPLQLAPLPRQSGLAIPRFLLAKQGFLAGVGGEKGRKLLIQLRLQLVEPAHGAAARRAW